MTHSLTQYATRSPAGPPESPEQLPYSNKEKIMNNAAAGIYRNPGELFNPDE
jgi:hypothetical protein